MKMFSMFKKYVGRCIISWRVLEKLKVEKYWRTLCESIDSFSE